MARARRAPYRETVKYLLLGFVLLFAYYPMLVMFSISFKNNEQFVNNPWFFDRPSQWDWSNWAQAWGLVSQYIANSIFTATTTTAIMMVLVIVTAYVVARYRFPGRTVFFYGLIATIFLPPSAASLVTTFNLLQGMNLMNSLWAIIISGSLGGGAMAVFILKLFIDGIPKDLFESAQIDGAGHLRQITTIVVPMTASILGVLAIQSYLGVWNELLLTLVMIRDEARQTLPLGLMMLDGEYHKDWGQLMGGYSIAALPLVVIFVFTMRLFVRGFAAGAVKG